MMKKKSATLAAIAGTLLMGSVFAVQAHRTPVNPADAQLDLAAAMAVAVAEVPGRIVEAELEAERGGQLVWEFELVSAEDGKRMELEIDANSGELLSKEEDDERGERRRNK